MELTTDEQRILTEWLGECWHEDGGLIVNHWSESLDAPTELRYCKHYPNCKSAYSYPLTETFKRIDFSDWRVVGRLEGKVLLNQCNITKFSSYDGELYTVRIYDLKQLKEHHGTMKTPQLAICRAVLEYLKRG